MILKIFIIFFLLVGNLNAETIKSRTKSFKIKKVEFSDFKNWKNDDALLALKAFVKSCNHMGRINREKVLSSELYNIKVKDLRNVCDIATVIAGTTNQDARTFFENWFTPFLVIDDKEGKTGLFTGYYEPTISASRNKNNIYQYPIYGRPDDLTDTPYFTRKEIEDGVLNSKNIELFYTDNKVNLIFLQVQGSGKIILDNGTNVKLSYNGKNNRNYTSIGSVLVKKKYMKKKKINAISIKEWFKENPDKIDEILNENESYVFFKERKDDYVRGAHGSILTPFRSIAVDYQLMPYGFPFWIETKIEEKDKKTKFERLVVSQDTGSAINGAVRADIFFGDSERAEELASKMNFKGRYYILLPNNIVSNIKKASQTK